MSEKNKALATEFFWQSFGFHVLGGYRLVALLQVCSQNFQIGPAIKVDFLACKSFPAKF